NGSVAIVAGNVVFTPTAGYTGPASFTYTISDGHGGTDTATVNITVSAPPLATPGSASGDEDTLLAVSLTGSDSDGTVQSVTVTTLPSHGTLFLQDGVTPVVAGTPLSPADAAQLVFKPDHDFNGSADVVFTVTDNDNLSSAPATFELDVLPVNDPPLAQNDERDVQASQTRTVSAEEGIILSASVDAGRDSDPEGDALTVTQVAAGTGAPSTAVSPIGVTVAGIYGDLLLRSDGSYDYVANRAGSIATGTQADDVFTYEVADGHGGLATATLTLHVAGEADTVTAGPPTIVPLANPLGLNAEYYGYNDFNPTGADTSRRHSDDGTLGNLDHVSDMRSIIDGRNGSAIVDSTTAAAENVPDARFTARSIDYGTVLAVSGSVGTNPNIAAGGSTAGLTNDNSQLFRLLNSSSQGDVSTLQIKQGSSDGADTAGAGPTSGLGKTSDAAIRFTGQAYLAAGQYDIRVRADDGFRLRLDDNTVAIFDNIQSPTTRVYTGVPIEGGLTSLELLYWEQGGNAVLKIEFKPSGSPDSSYQVLGSQSIPLFSDSNAPALTDLQDIVAGATPGTYNIRTGSVLDGGGGDDNLTGSAGRDHLIGGLGNDTLSGGGGADLIVGGKGDDQLTGGAGHDVFRWSLGDGGTTTTPAHDVITDFDNTNHAGDVLDLRDLLVGESHAANSTALPGTIAINNAMTVTPHEGNLADFLHFSVSGGNTVVEISSTGGFTAGAYNPAAVDQVITLSGLNLVGSFSNDHQIINDLLQRGKLVTD
ncbi:MAG: Ig-like domain-containing protein, partial [Burkholderiaceae bacterium]|nr:Ig-like domain-containing protein [Burkholderiaceae bacterium]